MSKESQVRSDDVPSTEDGHDSSPSGEGRPSLRRMAGGKMRGRKLRRALVSERGMGMAPTQPAPDSSGMMPVSTDVLPDSLDAPSAGPDTSDESALSESALSESALSESALSESALSESALSESALSESAARTELQEEDTFSDSMAPPGGFEPVPGSMDVLAATHPSDASVPQNGLGMELTFNEGVTLNEGKPKLDSNSGVHSDLDEMMADPLIGMEVAERYRIIEQIGRGGMGIVYRVEHTRIGKLLAMKLLTGELSSNKEIVRRFKQEALTVSKLSSPHTVQVFDYGVYNHLTYLVMELVEGHHLARALKRQGPMPFARLGPLIVQVCASLAEAHEKGIVHRDVKPENIMLIPDVHGLEVAKVLDFGLAKLRENSDLNAVTLQGAVVGTPYFMSPEQVTGDEVDGRTDIYSLGAVMFKALTGTYPFQAKTPMGMFSKHISEPAPAATERAPHLAIPPRISKLVQQCMAKSPDDRPDSVEDLCNVLVAELQAMGLETSDQLYFHARRSPNRISAVTRRKQELAQQVATRAELESYERKLRRTRYGAWASLSLVLAACAGGGAYLWRSSQQVALDREHEPNNVAAEASQLAFGVESSGKIGQRLEPNLGDRDFFVFDKQDDSQVVALTLTGVPSMPLCLMLYRAGFQQPMAQYCGGAAGQEIRVDQLRLDEGRYFVAVLQDMRPIDGAAEVLPLESISDRYTLSVKLFESNPLQESEPNDSTDGAWSVAPGSTVEGSLGWVGDVDVLCAQDGQGQVRWEIEDDKRSAGAVLQVTSLGEQPVPPVRVHPSGTQPFGRPRFEADVNSPWVSPPVEATAKSCVRLELTSDPWITNVGTTPRPSTHPYRVTLKSR